MKGWKTRGGARIISLERTSVAETKGGEKKKKKKKSKIFFKVWVNFSPGEGDRWGPVIRRDESWRDIALIFAGIHVYMYRSFEGVRPLWNRFPTDPAG